MNRSSLAMARRRRRGMRPWLCATLLGAVGTAGLAGLILLANEVTHLRTELAQLAERRTSVVVERAMLVARWNEASSQRVVLDRAAEELGLICPPDPGQVLVLAPPANVDDPDLWRRVIAAVGSGEAVPAAAAAGPRP